jgi:hypothetical protein
MRGWPSLEPWPHRKMDLGQCILRRSLCFTRLEQAVTYSESSDRLRLRTSAPKSLPRQSSKQKAPTLSGDLSFTRRGREPSFALWERTPPKSRHAYQNKNSHPRKGDDYFSAAREGFEPPEALTPQTLSRRPHSAALPPRQINKS